MTTIELGRNKTEGNSRNVIEIGFGVADVGGRIKKTLSLVTLSFLSELGIEETCLLAKQLCL